MRTLPLVIAVLLAIVTACGRGEQDLVRADGQERGSVDTLPDEPAQNPIAVEPIRKSVEQNGFLLSWLIRGTNLEVVVSAKTTGWIGVGFNPTVQMTNANVIMGYVADGRGIISDQYVFESVHHDLDESLGGTNDVKLIAASESGGVTVIEFSIPLDSGDKYDVVLEQGIEYPVLLAHGPNGADDFTTYHGTTRTTVRIEL